MRRMPCYISSRRGINPLRKPFSFTLKAMIGIGRILIVFGLFIMLAGALVLLAGKLNLPLGRLPGDITWRGKNSTFYFPLVTCLLLSVFLSLLFYLLNLFRR